MDSLTQIVLGAAVGEVAVGKKVGNWALLWGGVAGTIPDLDVFAKHFTDNVTALEIHRGFSHSILFSLIFAPIFGWLLTKIHKKLDATWKDWTLLMFLGLFTHPLLDAHTTWGTQLFWPFEYRIAYKNIFVVDPLYTLPFLACVIALMFYKKESLKRKRINQFGLIISSFYMVLTIGFKWLAYPKFINTLNKQNIEYVEVKTRPTPLNSILWSANVKLKDGFITGYYSLLDEQEDVAYSKLIPQNLHLLGDMVNEKKVKQLIKISEGWFTLEEREGKILLNDLRFGQNGIDAENSKFIFSFELKYNDKGEFEVIEQPRTFKQGGALISSLYDRIKGI
jgi:inner membrane protein